MLLLICGLCSCEVKKLAAGQPDIVEIELSEREQKMMQEKMRLDSLNQTLEWKEIRDGLFVNNRGDVGFKTASYRPDIEFTAFYITDFRNLNRPLNKVVDTRSFKLIAGEYPYGAYYKDKARIYHFFNTSDGGSFSIVDEADYNTFTDLGYCYARDKNHVYDLRFGIIKDVDVTTFKVASIDGRCLGKDKNGYYRDGSRLSDKQLAEPDLQKLKKKLDRK
jgi:hypothetical protein